MPITPLKVKIYIIVLFYLKNALKGLDFNLALADRVYKNV